MNILKEPRNLIKKIAAISVLLIILLALEELFRRSQVISCIVFLVLPIILIPWWREHEKHSRFGWIKLYSAAFAVLWFMFIRFTTLQNYQWAFFVVYLIVALNILEAVLLDIFKKTFSHYCNAAAGILLIVTLATYSSMGLDSSGLYRDLTWNIPVYWILGYTIWNLVIVYLHTPQHFGMHIAVLGSALIVGIIDNNLWIQARAYTLAIFFMLFFTYKPMFDPVRTPANTHQKLAVGGVALSLGWMIVIAVGFTI